MRLVETAIYVLLGALATALLALLALPAISRRAFRLAEARARLLAPLSETQARADRDALRARHAVDVARIERHAAEAHEAWSAAQIALGRRAAEIVARDADIADKVEEIAGQREEIAERMRDLRDRDVEIAAREVAMLDLLRQRDAANHRLADAWARLQDSEALVEEGRTIRASLERRVALLEIELADIRRASEHNMAAAADALGELKRKLIDREEEADRLQEQLARAPWPARANERPGDALPVPAIKPTADLERWRGALADSAAREHDLTVRLQALAAERDALAQDLAEAQTAASASERRAQAVIEGDKSLRLAIARLGREIAEGRTDRHAAERPLTSDLTL